MNTVVFLINWFLFLSGIAILAYDGFLELTGKETISRWYQKKYPRWKDWVAFVIGMIIICILPGWIDVRIKVVWAGFWGHITIANKERYVKPKG